jgi:hypothetical protein
MKPGSTVVVSLHSPKEKVWGHLLELSAAGITLRGIDLNSFDAWLNHFGSEDQTGMAEVFYPLYRVERILLDESQGHIASLEERFRQKTGLTLKDLLAQEEGGRHESE